MKRTGRPPSAKTLAARFTAKQVLETVDQAEMWAKLLGSKDERIKLDAWKYLNDRVYGKPAQALDVDLNGNIEVIKRVVLGKLG